MSIQRVSSKWAKTKALLRNKQIMHFIPTTLKYSLETLSDMLRDNMLVYIKPDTGTYGNGVMCVERLNVLISEVNEPVEHYRLQYGTLSESFDSLNHLHLAIMHRIEDKPYLIQKGIFKLNYDNRPFDLRILTQRTPSGTWESTGVVARVAGRNKIITNYHSGGTVKMLNEVLSEHASQRKISALEKQLYTLGEDTARQLQKTYPRLKEIGLDVAIDQDLYPWILEVNTLPALFPFKKFIKNKDVYQRIERYAIAYGRLSASTKGKRKSKA
ncbi:YheC/YheD family protein [Paenibacillus donghaensis]|uniref:YheC/YheD family protein n=1 Tax=Paenibacillus donghaensis TaxID=414771 RepID=UPI001883B032|nr:YheC/YheD family protein [Paenibacillus donghaensis]MBE9913598.1 YheC/YheD family protein [Paenibacillus donghaensis]